MAGKAQVQSSALTVEDADAMPEGTRGRTRQANPFDVPLQESHRNGKAKAVTVPEDKVKDVTAAIRGAAAFLGIGVQIRPVDAGNGNVKVYFQGKDKRRYNRSSL